MKFNPNDILIEPGHEARTWQSCDYLVNGIHLFHERTYFPYNVFKPVTSEQWLPGNASEEEIKALAAKYNGRAMQELYGEGYFLAFDDTEKAIAFCQTEDFDRLVLTDEKVG